MSPIVRLFQKITWGTRIWVLAVAVAGIVGAFEHQSQERDFKPLFTRMAAEDAGPLLAKLHDGGAEYRLADNGTTVLVPSAQVAELRIQMASAGLPKSGRMGFELFDKTNFGASEFAEQVNYQRAIEGELERSVMSIRDVEQARVRVTMAKDSLYTEMRQPAKASVLVKLRPAAALSSQNVSAICQLAASAVPGLAAAQVAVIDTDGNLLNRSRPDSADAGSGSNEAGLEYRKSVERDVQNKIAATLEPLLGEEHFRVGVSVEVDRTSTEQNEELSGPQEAVKDTSRHMKDDLTMGLFTGDDGPPTKSAALISRPPQTGPNALQSSRLVKHSILPQGDIKRLSLTVLVDQRVHWEVVGGKPQRVADPSSAEKLSVIREVVAAAAGLDPARGDRPVVDTLPFETTLSAEQINPDPAALPQTSASPVPEKHTALSRAAAAGGMLLLITATLLILHRTHQTTAQGVRSAVAPADLAGKTIPPAAEAAPPPPESVVAKTAHRGWLFTGKLGTGASPTTAAKNAEVFTRYITDEAKSNPSRLARIVKGWLRG